MPFKSEKQRRYMHANLPEIAQRWEQEYSNGGIMRLGYRRGGDTMGGPNDRSSKGIKGPAGGASAGGNYGGNRNPSQTYGDGDSGSPGITGGKSPSAFTEVTKDVLNPQEDFVGETIFGPTQKYTGKSSWFGGANKYGYTDQYTDPRKANFGQLKPGYGGRLLGGLASMATGIPFIGSTLGSMYDKYKPKGYFEGLDESEQRRLNALNLTPYNEQKISLTSFTEDDPSNLNTILEEAYINYLTDAPPDPMSFDQFKSIMLDREEAYKNIVNVGDI